MGEVVRCKGGKLALSLLLSLSSLLLACPAFTACCLAAFPLPLRLFFKRPPAAAVEAAAVKAASAASHESCLCLYEGREGAEADRAVLKAPPHNSCLRRDADLDLALDTRTPLPAVGDSDTGECGVLGAAVFGSVVG